MTSYLLHGIKWMRWWMPRRSRYIKPVFKRLQWFLPQNRIIWTVLFFVFVLMSSPYIIFKYIHLLSDFNEFRNVEIRNPCVLPKFSAFEDSIGKFFWHPEPIKCKPLPDLVFVDENGVLQINQTAVGLSGHSGVHCHYNPIFVEKDEIVDFQTEALHKIPAKMTTEFFQVKCKDKNNKDIYENIHYSINYRDASFLNQFKEEKQDHLSVYIYGMESTSRLIAERKIPKTLDFIRKELGGYIFKGYTQVGDGTFANVLAMLTGISIKNYATHVDNTTFIWNNFSDLGYVNLYSEDQPNIQTIKGFSNQPTHHYGRPYYLSQDRILSQLDKALSVPLAFLQHNNLKITGTSSMCYGNKPKHVRMLEYWRRFMEVYDKKLKFSFVMNVGLTHDFINFAELADNDLYEHFRWMKGSGKLDNAVLILVGDHGQRYSDFRSTEIGRVTNFLPFASIVLPQYFRDRYPHLHATLTKNIDRLTSHYDMFQTLVDIMNRNFAPRDPPSGNAAREPTSETLEGLYGISLFQEIPETRSCFDANIPENMCPCYSARKLNVENKHIKELGLFLIGEINKLMEEFYTKCAKLKFSSVVTAKEIYASFERPAEFNNEFNIRKYLFRKIVEKTRYLVVVQAEPCGGHFEGMIEVGQDGGFTLMGMINRVNSYGTQSHCMTTRLPRLYCCCLSSPT